MTDAFPVVPSRPTVRVVHPCGGFDDTQRARLRKGVEALERAGCRVRWDATAAQRPQSRGYLAGTDSQRRRELIEAFTEPGVDVVWAARGGSGAARIARDVTDALERHAPRLLVGFSDVTTLIAAFTQRLGWPSVHGPVVTTLANRHLSQGAVADLDQVLAVLTGHSDALSFSPQAGEPLRAPLVGGNLTVLASLCGMGLLPTLPRALWVLEDTHEAPYQLDRAYTQLRGASMLSRAAAVWFGDLSPAPLSRTLRTLAADLKAPLYRDAPAGHQGRIAALPMGVTVDFDPARGQLRWRTDRAHA